MLRRKAAGERRKELNPERRRFMLGAAGLTFGVAAGVPALLEVLKPTRRRRRASR